MQNVFREAKLFKFMGYLITDEITINRDRAILCKMTEKKRRKISLSYAAEEESNISIASKEQRNIRTEEMLRIN